MSAPPGIPARQGYGSGCYRRRIRLETSGDCVRGELADDFHHFRVRVAHDGKIAVTVGGEDVRVPWATCSGAAAHLERMHGIALRTPLLEIMRHTPAREQCTHLHDLACLAIAHAGRSADHGASVRQYDIAMPDRVDRRTRCTIIRDGEPIASWEIEGMNVTAATPSECLGLEIGSRDFRAYLAGEENADLAEAAWVLQRAIFIGLGRQHDFEAMPDATKFASMVGGGCYSFDPVRVAEGKRVYGTVRDFTEDPDGIFEPN